MKKVLALLLCLSLMMFALVGCGEEEGVQNGDKVIKIGVYEPASGDNGAGGKQETLGIQYANSLVNTVTIGGEEYKVELAVVDNQSSTDKAKSAASDLIGRGISIALGSYGSAVSIAAAPTFEEAKTAIIGVSCTNPSVTLNNPYYYRICFLDPFQGAVLANFAYEELEATTAYVLTELGDDYSVGLGYYFAEEFKKLGGEVVEATFQNGNNDFSAFLANAVNAEADVIFAPTSTTAASLIITQAADAKLSIPLLAGDTWDSPVILDAVNGKDVPIYLSTFYDEGSSDTAAEFLTGFKAWLNADAKNLENNGGTDIVAAVSALGYDAYFVALEAIKAADSTDPDTIAQALADVTYSGVTGDVVFDENGDVAKEAIFIKAANNDGTWESIKAQGVTE